MFESILFQEDSPKIYLFTDSRVEEKNVRWTSWMLKVVCKLFSFYPISKGAQPFYTAKEMVRNETLPVGGRKYFKHISQKWS